MARLFLPKQVIVRTHEPSFDTSAELRVPAWPGEPVLVCNVFTGHVFWHNLHFLGSYHYDSSVDLGLDLTPVDLDVRHLIRSGTR